MRQYIEASKLLNEVLFINDTQLDFIRDYDFDICVRDGEFAEVDDVQSKVKEELEDKDHEFVDGQIDIYYHDLRQWAVDNYDKCEQAVEEGLSDGTDYHKMIQAGQFLAIGEELDVYGLFESIGNLEQYELENGIKNILDTEKKK